MYGLNSCGSWGLEHRLNSCGALAELLNGKWDLSELGIEYMSSALAVGFFTKPVDRKLTHKII